MDKQKILDLLKEGKLEEAAEAMPECSYKYRAFAMLAVIRDEKRSSRINGTGFPEMKMHADVAEEIYKGLSWYELTGSIVE